MEILLLAVAFTLLVILGASEQVIRQTVNRTCIEGMHYTEQTGRKKRHRRRPDLGKGTFNKKKRSETQELCVEKRHKIPAEICHHSHFNVPWNRNVPDRYGDHNWK